MIKLQTKQNQRGLRMLLISAIIFVGIGAVFTYSLYKFADHELRHKNKNEYSNDGVNYENINMKRFDLLAYVQQARKLGVSEELAEFQARQIGAIADAIQENQQEIEALKKIKLATKKP